MWTSIYLKCIWQTFFAQLNLPNVQISVAKKIFDSDFPSPCFDVPKASNFTSGGVQDHDTKNRRLGTIVTSIQDSKHHEKQISQSFSYSEPINLLRHGTIVHCLWGNKKMSEKSVFREAWSPELTSQSFPVPSFWSCGFVPHWKWNLMLLVHQNTGKENRYGKNFFAVLISTLGRFNRANKKNLSYTLKVTLSMVASEIAVRIYSVTAEYNLKALCVPWLWKGPMMMMMIFLCQMETFVYIVTVVVLNLWYFCQLLGIYYFDF